jgi:hypothetical protein
MASETIGNLYPTEIPGYADNADIQEAFRLYHYGSLEYDKDNSNAASLVNPSIAYTLNDLQVQIDDLDPAGSVSKTVIDAKGDLIIGSAADSVAKLSVGSDNFVLTADAASTNGVKWAAPAVTLSNSVTLVNKTLTSPVINNPTVSGLSLNDSSIVFEGSTVDANETTISVIDPTSDRSIVFPNASGTVQLEEISFNPLNGTGYTFLISDKGKMIKATNSSEQIYYIPTNSSVAFPVGTQIHLIGLGTGVVNIQAVTPATTTILSTAAVTNQPKIRVQYGSVTCIKADTDTWYVIGDII